MDSPYAIIMIDLSYFFYKEIYFFRITKKYFETGPCIAIAAKKTGMALRHPCSVLSQKNCLLLY